MIRNPKDRVRSLTKFRRRMFILYYACRLTSEGRTSIGGRFPLFVFLLIALYMLVNGQILAAIICVFLALGSLRATQKGEML